MHLPQKSAQLPPLIAFVHGGAWITGDKKEYTRLCESFSKEGFAVANINYRLSTKPNVVYPQHAEDVAAALQFLIQNKETHPYDPSKIFLMGHSAGAHMAALIAADKKYLAPNKNQTKSPKAYIGLAGIYDVPKLSQRWPTYKAWFLDKAFGADESVWAKASPSRLEFFHKAPWLVVYSEADELVEEDQALEFAAHLKEQKIKAQVLKLKNKKHFDLVKDFANEADPLIQEIVKFMRSL